ncbi:LysR family transcriptional regulator ArgP [Frigidibacter sp. RF13]|uniref:LysR family transcriptional regulator ArgP n=1 Tax=Frigidibacter sp. RF13 TaxID=2997340 RepID=UPI00226F8D51|nr:LysR family transcriptional regulator ArgP [Frigidibacter sp. RF13]MCY1127325.1 LysR family transcriptional regulator ArgP [Frigidibacter sp. RF13]
MIDPDQLATLAAILRTGSFEGAARALNVTPSAISQRLRALEERLGTILVLRTQPAQATEAGQRLARHADDLALLENTLMRDLGLGGDRTRPTVRIAVNADSLATWVLPALAATPDLLFDLVIDDQDHSAELLRRGEVAAALTAASNPVQGATAHAIGALAYRATCAPAFRDCWFPGGITADTLSRAPALTFNSKDRLQADWAQALTGRPVTLPTHHIASSHAFVEAALLGLGWGMNPEHLIADHLARGALVDLAPDHPLLTPLHWQVSRLHATLLAPLTAAVRRAAKAALTPA